MLRGFLISILAAISLCCAIAQTAPSPSATTKQDLDSLPAGAGKELVQKSCVSCHNIRIVTAKRGTEEEWNQTVDKMITAHGVALSDDDADVIVKYLSTNFGPSAGKPSADPAPPAPNSH